jgi:hypothetical protein
VLLLHQKLISNPQATIHEIVEGKQTEIFFPNKSIGLNANQYVDCKRDVSSHGRGSILCKDIGLTTKKKYVSAILSISTYGLQICSENDNDAIKLLLETILPAYVKRIQLELTLLYIKEIMAVPSKKPRVNRNS